MLQEALVSTPSTRSRYAIGATTNEVAERFRIDRQTVPKVFGSALAYQGGTGNPAYWSRSMICDLLSAWNGRTVAYPSSPLMTLEQVRGMLLLAGYDVSREAIAWAAQKPRTTLYKGAYRQASPPLEVVKVGWVVRVTHDAALDFLERWKAYAAK